MTKITIPKEINTLKNTDLVAVPRNAYEEFLVWQKRVKSIRTFKPTAQEKKALQRARRNFARGKYTTLGDLKHELGISR